MNQKELTKTFMIISICKQPFGFYGLYKNKFSTIRVNPRLVGYVFARVGLFFSPHYYLKSNKRICIKKLPDQSVIFWCDKDYDQDPD